MQIAKKKTILEGLGFLYVKSYINCISFKMQLILYSNSIFLINITT